MECSLAARECVPCKGGTPPLTPDAITPLLAKLDPSWAVEEDKRLIRAFKFRDFREALAFVNRVGALAENQHHHPDMLLAWGRAVVTLWTHKIDGLTESDFILAAKIDALDEAP